MFRFVISLAIVMTITVASAQTTNPVIVPILSLLLGDEQVERALDPDSPLFPPRNQIDVNNETSIVVSFDGPVNGLNPDETNFVVHRGFRGKQLPAASDGFYFVDNFRNTLSFITPNNQLFPGEKVAVSLTADLEIKPQVFEFTAEVPTISFAQFIPRVEPLGTEPSRNLALGDLNGDNFLDAVIVNTAVQDAVYVNDGSGGFSEISPAPGFIHASSNDVALGHIDRDDNPANDGSLDAFFAINGINQAYRNDGNGQFTPITQTTPFPANNSLDVALGDLDGDGDLDAYVANASSADRIYLNDGAGQFASLAQSAFTSSTTQSVALGDLDNDGDLDAFISGADRVYLNDGEGQFTAHAQTVPFTNNSFSVVALGDLDDDGDLDAFVTRFNQSHQVYVNDGAGQFTLSASLAPPSFANSHVVLGDLNGDGSLDAYISAIATTNSRQPNQFYLNNGSGGFTIATQIRAVSQDDLGDPRASALGDIDGDGDLDAVEVSDDRANRVWINSAPEIVAFAFADQPNQTNFYTPPSRFQATAGPGFLPLIQKVATGVYTVVFNEGSVTSSDTLQVSAYHGDSSDLTYCNPNIPPTGFPQVRCFDHNGMPSDSMFMASFIDYGHSSNANVVAYATGGGDIPFTEQDGFINPVALAPATTSYNSYDNTNTARVQRTAIGEYIVAFFNAEFVATGNQSIAHVVAQDSTAHCAITRLEAQSVRVRCFDGDGVMVNSLFNVSVYATDPSDANVIASATISATGEIIGTPYNPLGSITVMDVSPSQLIGVPEILEYDLSFSGISARNSLIQINAQGSDDLGCSVGSANGTEIQVLCRNSAPQFKQTDFNVVIISE